MSEREPPVSDPQPTLPPSWVELTDEDRKAAFESLPDMLEGFLKTWGWLHFAKAIEAQVKARNAHLLPKVRVRKEPRPKSRRAAGGHARAAVLSPERRREIALKANAARWNRAP